MAEPIRVAVIGGGNMGRHHVRIYAEMFGVELVALADPRPAAAALAEERGARYYPDYLAMLAAENVDAVSIVVPTALHLEIAEAAIAADAHVLVEKPIAATVAEAEQMTASAAAAGKVLAVGHIERYNPVVRQLKRLISEGAVGTVSSVTCKRLGGFPLVQPPTNVIIDLAIHDIDVISYVTGQPAELLGAHGSRTFHPEQIDSAELLLRYGTASGLVQSNWVTPVKIRSISVTGSRGYLEGNYVSQEVVQYEASVNPEDGAWSDFVSHFGNPRQVVHAETPREPLVLELEVFVSACRGRSGLAIEPAEATAALATALKAMQIIGAQHG